MTTLKIEQHDAERLISSILREELKLQPARANEIATTVCTRISLSGLDLLRSGYGAGWRAIGRYPPQGDATAEMVAELRRTLPQADKSAVDLMWEMIYARGREVPDFAMADM